MLRQENLATLAPGQRKQTPAGVNYSECDNKQVFLIQQILSRAFVDTSGLAPISPIFVTPISTLSSVYVIDICRTGSVMHLHMHVGRSNQSKIVVLDPADMDRLIP
jgi:hypothetical protein